MSNVFCDQPCNNCPFAKHSLPYLDPEFAADVAQTILNKQEPLFCHKKQVGADNPMTHLHISENDQSLRAVFGDTSGLPLCSGAINFLNSEIGYEPPNMSAEQIKTFIQLDKAMTLNSVQEFLDHHKADLDEDQITGLDIMNVPYD